MLPRTKQWLPLASIAALLLTVATTTLAADDPEPEVGKPRATIRSSDAEKPKTAGADDEELFRKLLDETGDQKQPQDNLLERAIQGMRDAQKRIDNSDSGSKTQQLQNEVVENLEQLIEQLKQQQAKSRRQRSARTRPAQKQGNQDPSNPAEATADDGDQTKKGKSPESNENPRDAEKRNAKKLLTPKELTSHVWGHLPPTYRNKLLNVYSDTYLPKYEHLVGRYFEALAEKGRTGKQLGF